ncbi:hypothetical protein HMN09_01259800 [Mycena chlorophos]|uniref:Metal-dependent protein hydrolase n=1 Tax=Mycena chlorophos TaxID=658473 RepID=A0A8H6S5H7_MYCCL|nr:hypothetical protein HMN09_01259800 [Mycena chlorophos]
MLLRRLIPTTTRLLHSTHLAMAEPQAKKLKLEKTTIGTHSGTFHCDEALAVFLLRNTEKYRDSEVKRSRDQTVLDTCDIVVDVGAVYDESRNLFDHHQRGFTEVFGHGFETKLSSAGLVYKHFGKEVIASKIQLSIDDPKVTTLWLKLYKQFIEAIDAIDNGISQYNTDVSPRYKSSTDLGSRVASLNPWWNQPFNSETLDAQFEKASRLTGEEFMGKLDFYANAWLPARDLLISAIEASKATDPTGKIILIAEQEHLFDFEAEQQTPEADKAIYVVYPDEGGNWRIQAVPVASESFESRKALPEAWRGLRDDTLSSATGVDGCVFVHASGFIGGNKTKEGALKLAQMALAM